MKASELSFTYLAFSQRADSLAHSLRSRRGPGENGEFFFLRLLHFPRAISRKERHSHEAGHGTSASSPCSSSSSSRFGYTTEVALGSESSEDPPPGLCSQVDLHWMGETNICSSGPVAPPPARSLAPSLSPNANGNKQQQKTATASAAAPRSASPATPSERSSRSPPRQSSWRSSKGAGAAGSSAALATFNETGGGGGGGGREEGEGRGRADSREGGGGGSGKPSSSSVAPPKRSAGKGGGGKGDLWLAELSGRNPALALRVMEVRAAYAAEDFEWDQCRRLATEGLAAANLDILKARLGSAWAAADASGSNDDDEEEEEGG